MSEPYQVLIVDDDEIDRMAVERAFRRQCVTNRRAVARDGAEALELLRSGAVRAPYVILLDLNMPRMSGLELLEALRADPEHRDAWVYVISTSRAEADRAAARALGVKGFVSKDRFAEEFWPAVAEHDLWVRREAA